MLSADANLFLYAANPDSDRHGQASVFFASCHQAEGGFAICELVLIELYMLLRNPAVLKKSLTPPQGASFCDQLRQNCNGQHFDYHHEVSGRLWKLAGATISAFRRIIDARLALTLEHHGVTHFATVNTQDFLVVS